ncbi:MAG: family 1 glycosylhydrolase [Verrucomicrobiae bacterium]|nr:family 1 glycosylhydrolase [Verrucomicrobiae bacterium]
MTTNQPLPRRADFPAGFLWGVATAAVQIEGMTDRGKSQWDAYASVPGRVVDGSTPAVATDSYRLWQEDFRLLAELGVNAYRFGLMWSRVQPTGRGKPNQRGLDFYARLIDELLARGITPLVTVSHAEHPQPLEENGGWLNRDMIYRFADYASIVFDAYGDRVPYWLTINEPNCFNYQGYGTGTTAPGRKGDWAAAYQAIHHQLTAHGEAVRRFRDVRRPGKIGLAMSVDVWAPATDDPRDVAAAQAAEMQNNWWLLDPLYLGRYPETMWEQLGPLVPRVEPGDLAVIATPTDFFGLNYYARNFASAGGENFVLAAKGGVSVCRTESYPQGIPEIIATLKRRYGKFPVIITENGLYAPPTGLDDPARVEFLQAHIAAVADALRAGYDVRGYIVWTLMDNWEWTAGFTPRLGLYYTDFTTQARVPKTSAKWYREFLRA